MKKMLFALPILLLMTGLAFAETETFDAHADIGNEAPAIDAYNVTSDAGQSTNVTSDSPVNEGSTMYFNADISDANDDTVQLIVCNASGFTDGNCTETDGFICSTTLSAAGNHQCSYEADSQVNGDPATSWTAYFYAYDGTGETTENTETYTNHNPTVSGSLAIDEATVYADSTMTVNIGSASKTDEDSGDTTSYEYRFRDNDDSTVLQDWSATNTYDCSGDSGDTGNGYCTKGDTIYVDVRAKDSHDAVSDGTEETYIEITKGITNTAPVIDDVKIDGEDSPSINPTEGTTTSVVLTFNVTDYDRTNDATELSAGTSDGTATGAEATNSSCVYSNVDSDTDTIECTIAMNYNVAGGSKTVTVNVADKTDADTDSDTAHSFTYTTIYVLSLNDSALSFGSFTPDTTGNSVDENQLLSNTGNGVLDITVQASDLTLDANTWEVGNFSVDDDASYADDTDNKPIMSLTSSAQDYSPNSGTGIAVDGTYALYYYVSVPLGLTSGTYTSSSNWEIVSSEHT